MRVNPARLQAASMLPGLDCGIYPYLGGSATVAELGSAVREYGCAAVPGLSGVRLATRAPGSLADPARYSPRWQEPVEQPNLFGMETWLERQEQAQVPVILTDSPRIGRGDRLALRAALARWPSPGRTSLAVLPVEAWWLKGGLSCLIEEVTAARRPVALVLAHHYNGLDEAGAVAGLITFLSATGLPSVLLRSDISAVGAVAHGAFAGFIGHSASTRHGPLPRRAQQKDASLDDLDLSPSVFVPALNDYIKASRLPVLARNGEPGILECHDPVCSGASLLRLARLSETDLSAARKQACQHNMASHETVAWAVLSSAEPRDAWWELCKAGADNAASMAGHGVILPVPRWLRQWLEIGSPSHEPLAAR